ncbi:MAG TPA: oligopeptide/dipeptide ABC transporter ATP-binding protein, partial [Polyangiaceae bacterium]|nr:oligopeptide/dipeptide ABC transporter ATP-binding protein [Polyangiaceae bacterium]
MYAGRIVESGPVRAVFARPCHPYTHGLMASIPRLGQRRRAREGNTERVTRLPTIEGMVPDLRHLPRGCRFADRCKLVIEACREKEPELVSVDQPDHVARCIRWKDVSP